MTFREALRAAGDLAAIGLFVLALLVWLPASEREHRAYSRHYLAQQMGD